MGQRRQLPRSGQEFLSEELETLLPKAFLSGASFERLEQFPRYLKALQVRADRALINPAKDQEKAKLIQPFTTALREFRARNTISAKALACVDDLRWMLEEFKISIFAQELGTAFPISAKRLDAQLTKCREQLH